MAGFDISTAFHPLRLTAYSRSDVELKLEIENEDEEPYWTECVVEVPDVLSLVPDRDVRKGKIRVGIIAPGEVMSGKCKIYATARTYPEIYVLKITVFGYSRDGGISLREEKRVDLRCERIT
ncbi:hypothetical protein DRN67_03455 [Candidatus Micrarchaeota archaeon]|nr:MAG: hypothetical protein DRN67_03455 [Candidatus Micrarchaeota archaeon]